jgi:5-carboxymethyl-2-hydroxymuconate isomerase
MPHCTLEYSSNVIDQINAKIVLKEIHLTLARTGLFKLNDIKGRAIMHQDYCVGDGDEMRGFAALSIGIFPGRDFETRCMITRECMEILQKHFPESLQKLKFDITVQIDTLDKESYLKIHSND